MLQTQTQKLAQIFEKHIFTQPEASTQHPSRPSAKPSFLIVRPSPVCSFVGVTLQLSAVTLESHWCVFALISSVPPAQLTAPWALHTSCPPALLECWPDTRWSTNLKPTALLTSEHSQDKHHSSCHSCYSPLITLVLMAEPLRIPTIWLQTALNPPTAVPSHLTQAHFLASPPPGHLTATAPPQQEWWHPWWHLLLLSIFPISMRFILTLEIRHHSKE